MSRPTLFKTANVVPLVGIFLALFVVMLASLPQKTVSTQLSVTPMDPPSDLWSGDGAPIVSLETDGSVVLNGERVDRTALVGAIREKHPKEAGYSTYVLVRADQSMPYGAFADLAAELRTAGFAVGLINEDVAAS